MSSTHALPRPAGMDGALRFARYAYPPNVLGHCGTSAHQELLERVSAAAADPGLLQLARGFHGAWPYLELIAGAAHGQPLDADVVEAYWIGSDLLQRVDMADLGRSVEDRFKRRAGLGWRHLEEGVPGGGVPHHSFHVFCVYPWVGLLDTPASGHAREVLDRCRVRTGVVEQLSSSTALVRSRPLSWDGRRLGSGAAVLEEVTLAADGHMLVEVAVGDVVALHWDWVCDRLTPRQASTIERITARHIALANARLAAAFVDALGEPTASAPPARSQAPETAPALDWSHR